MRRLAAAALGAALLAAACGGGEPVSAGADSEPVGRDPAGDLRFLGNSNPWEFMDIVEFSVRRAGDGVEGYVEFLHPPDTCPKCTFTIELETGGQVLVAEFSTEGTRFVERTLRLERDGMREALAPDYDLRWSGTRIEFALAAELEPGAVMRVSSFHDEGGGQNDKAVDVTETPFVLGGG